MTPQVIAVFGVLLFLSFGLIHRFHKIRLKKALARLKEAQETLRHQSEFLRLASEATRSAIWESRPATGQVYLSAQWFAMLGYAPQKKDVMVEEALSYVHPDDRVEIERLFENHVPGDDRLEYEIEHRLRRADGTWCWVLSTAKAVELDGKGAPSRVVGLDVNIETLRDTREKMAQSEARFRAIFENAPYAMAITGLEDNSFLEVNKAFLQRRGITMEEAREMGPEDISPVPREEIVDIFKTLVEKGSVTNREFDIIKTDGTRGHLLLSSVLLEIEGRKEVLTMTVDVTERKKAEEATDFERRQLLSIFNSLDEIIYVSDPSTHELLFANQCLQTLIGKDPTGGLCYRELQRLDAPCDFCTNPIILNNGGMPHRWEYHNPVTSTDVAIVDQIIRWPDGRDVRLEIAVDITQKKRAEEDRKILEAQLHQSQKMEAIGILAGGVAHDFNNMLGAIMGHAELTMSRMDSKDPLRKNLGGILDAAQRSARLTQQLLAFARKQAIEPVILDLNESVESVLKMTRRLIGENIELIWLPGKGPYTVEMDPTQVDQILVNLCVNARDAIEDVGRVTIETDLVSFDEAYLEIHSWVTPGEYVLLAVSDDGAGMDKETLRHVFEPFFTTKGPGRGTGMGLATVYGIVKQNKGFIHAYSEPGRGTTFKIYIPSKAAEAMAGRPESAPFMPLSRGETVMIVEDDPTVLELSMMMLQQLGYVVIATHSPNEAIGVAEEDNSEIDLVITDVVMPEMNGRELVDRLMKILPDMKYLFMSGYTAAVIAQQGVLEKDVNFIQKPFKLKDLATKIRRILD